VNVGPLAVHLPDLDDGVAHRIPLGIEDPPGQVRDLADGGRDGVVDDEQVVVGVQRELVRVERPLGLPRRADQLLGEQAARREGRRAERQGAQEGAAVTARQATSGKSVHR
jgi:hypothetical protein